MALGDFNFDPPTGHNDTSVFPDYPARDQVRPLLQKLFDQIKTWLNGDVKTFVNGIDASLTAHKAETVSHVTFATRDISLTGEQIISVLAGKTPKSVKIYASITLTSIASWGVDNFAVNQVHDGTMSDNTYAVIATTASGVSARATVTKEVGLIKLNWTKVGSPTGTVRMTIETTYHGGA